jgi:uncharacterized membrane protein YgcG
MDTNYYPKLDMDSILPVDTDKVVNPPDVEASTFASESPHITLPGAYHVAPSPTTSPALQGRALSFNRSLISSITEDHHNDDATIMVVVPTASVVQENDVFAGRIVEAALWEDPTGPLEAMNSSNNPLTKDAVWMGNKRVRIFLFVVFVVIAAIVTGLTTALIRSERDQEEGGARFPPPPPVSSNDGVKESKKRDDGSQNSGSGSGGGGGSSGGNRA